MKLGLPDGSSEPTTSTERRSYDLLTEGFGPGFNGTLTVVVDAPEVARSEQEAFGKEVAADLQDFPGVAAVSPAMPNEAGDLWIVQVTPETGPASDETRDLVTALRDKAAELPKDAGITAYVTGQTAVNIDTADRLTEALPTYIAGRRRPRAAAADGRLPLDPRPAEGRRRLPALDRRLARDRAVWIFQDGNLNGLFDVASAGPIISFLPILLIGILFGLAMDYEVFLVSRMRERFVHSGDAQEAVRTGYIQSGRVVIAAATIMMRRLRRLHPVRRPDHQVDRPLAGLRRPGRRVPRPPDAGPGRDGAARQARLVDAQADERARAKSGHRGRQCRIRVRPFVALGRTAPNDSRRMRTMARFMLFMYPGISEEESPRARRSRPSRR